MPRTLEGRISCLLYALFGIPLILVTIADMGRFLSGKKNFFFFGKPGKLFNINFYYYF